PKQTAVPVARHRGGWPPPKNGGRRPCEWKAGYSPPADLSTNGYETITMPPPCGAGNSQRRTAPATHCSTAGLFIVEFDTIEATTWPVPLMVNWTITRPYRAAFFMSSFS